MNKDKVLAVANAIENHPEEFNMKVWCGTACCIAGWTVRLFAPSKYTHFNEREIKSTAQAELGLSRDQVFPLFYGLWSDKPLEQITAKEAADHLRSLVETL